MKKYKSAPVLRDGSEVRWHDPDWDIMCLYCGQEVENPCRTSGGALNCRGPGYTHETVKIEGSDPKLNSMVKKSMRRITK